MTYCYNIKFTSNRFLNLKQVIFIIGNVNYIFSDIYTTLNYPYSTTSGKYEEEAIFSRLYIAKVCKIKTVERKPAKRCMVMIQKQRPEAIIVEEQVLQTANCERSAWYQQLTSDFYL